MQDEYRVWLDTQYRPIGGASPEADAGEGTGEGENEGGGTGHAGTGEEGKGGKDKGEPDARAALDRVNTEKRELRRLLTEKDITLQQMQQQIIELSRKAQTGDEGAQDKLDDLDAQVGEGFTTKVLKLIDKRFNAAVMPRFKDMIDESLAPFAGQAVNAEFAEVKGSPHWEAVSEQMENRLAGLHAQGYRLKPGDVTTLFEGYVGQAAIGGKLKARKLDEEEGEIEGVLSPAHNSPGLPRKPASVKITPEIQKFADEHHFTDMEAAASVWNKKQELAKVAEKNQAAGRERQAVLKR